MKINEKVVVSKSIDTIIYTIESIQKGIAYLSYMSGSKKVSGGSIPVYCLMNPTKDQRIKHEKSKTIQTG